MLGKAAVAMWWDIAPGMQAEFEDWHTHEHMPERLGIPGFLRGTRWVALGGEPSYCVVYEAAELATVTSGPYLERLNNPTPWSRKMMPHHLDIVRSLCHVRASFGGGLSHALGTVRFSPQAGATVTQLISQLPSRKGLTAAHLLESVPAHEIPRTTEQKIRGGTDARADWVLLVGGYDAAAVRAVIENDFASLGGVTGFYRVSHTLSAPR